ncbi:hypothetical protein KEJ27_03005 [Candidatus Bathyarchaeota archaeon]|nr:hypothetical protein [Candidatus Bathyarchaeota archaeon]
MAAPIHCSTKPTYACSQKTDSTPSNTNASPLNPVFVKDIASEIIEKPYYHMLIKVSSKERTFIECIARTHTPEAGKTTSKALKA